MPSHSASPVRCDCCERRIEDGETYYETLVARRVVGDPPPMYAAKSVQCADCDSAEHGCPCVGTPDQEECPHG